MHLTESEKALTRIIEELRLLAEGDRATWEVYGQLYNIAPIQFRFRTNAGLEKPTTDTNES